VYDRASDTLVFGVLAATGGSGAVSALGPSQQSTVELFTTPSPPMFVAVDSRRRLLYVGTAISVGGVDRTQVELRDLPTNATIRTRVLDRGPGLAGAVLDEAGGLMFVTGPLRDRESDQVLAIDAASLEVLASAEVPWDPYGHGIAVDSEHRHVFVSSRVRPASVTTISFSIRP
jgi:DNA-binding beta-propeller fold protein YncE